MDFETFHEDMWDYVSEEVVDDSIWTKKQEFIREYTYDLYKLYVSKIKMLEPHVYETPLTIKECAKITENIFSKMIKFGMLS